jgi:L-ribulose-5-phosphate 4-epimerase
MSKPNYPKTEAAFQEFIAIARRLFFTGIQTSTGGNLSLLAEDGNVIVTKPSGIALFDCTAENLLVVDRRGQILRGQAPPTKELWFHLGVYEIRPDIGGVVHAHPPGVTAFACARRDLPLDTVHAKRILKNVPRIGPFSDGSPELALKVKEQFGDTELKAVILEEHGAIGVGPTLTQAENIMELLEETAKIAIGKRTLALAWQ